MIRKYAGGISSNGEQATPDLPGNDGSTFIETDRLDKLRREHPRAYEPWTVEEEQELEQLHSIGLDVAEVAYRLGRQPGAIQSRLNRLGKDPDGERLGVTHALTQRLLQQGLTVDEIAKERGLSSQTVLAHVERIVSAGEAVDLGPMLPSSERTARIKAALQAAGDDRLAPVKELLGDDYSYEEIRLVRIADAGVKK